ncbi:hypothetical protein LTS08_007198 [Lithohypha guttulata]|uniref:Uncharacterized protein n=1 Tax=Lithohypha guttulata TaxID=1690604 RepID=A0AAN7Y7C7_9EURO|nr:hypothetical protein LTR05_003953 [Lithohypha guttulata]KAK5097177.1 hypothetical protein LTS08_007198 [Lithohypha guttulata]
MSSTGKISVLGIGLPIPKEMDPNGDALAKITAHAASKNIELTSCLIDMAGTDDEEIVKLVKEKLNEQQYTVISFGWAFRAIKEINTKFERVLNVCVQMQPGARMGFPTSPQEMLTVVERVMA